MEEGWQSFVTATSCALRFRAKDPDMTGMLSEGLRVVWQGRRDAMAYVCENHVFASRLHT